MIGQLLTRLRLRKNKAHANAVRANALLRGDVQPVDGQTVRFTVTVDVAECFVAKHDHEFVVMNVDRSIRKLFQVELA